jgi:hypothetical protein
MQGRLPGNAGPLTKLRHVGKGCQSSLQNLTSNADSTPSLLLTVHSSRLDVDEFQHAGDHGQGSGVGDFNFSLGVNFG